MPVSERWPALAVAVLLLLAILPLPYGYYTLLRLVVTVAAVRLAYREYGRSAGVTAFVVVFAGIALLFNPIVPVHLPKEWWQVLDTLVAGAFGAWFWVRRG